MIEVLRDKTVLVTGGTGSIGKEIVKQVLRSSPKQVRVFSRDQSKQLHLQHELENDARVRYLVGDIRDKERVKMAMEGVDIVFHAAALKHVVSCEYNPFEAVKTNVLGLQNVIEAALEREVERFVFISTDKAADPANVMGSTKALGEKLVTNAYYYKGHKKTIFACVRFGNVLGSDGSVVPIWKKQIEKGGPVTINDPDMRRFFMSIPQAAKLTLDALKYSQVNEIFVLKMPFMKIGDLAEVMINELAPKYGHSPEKMERKIIGKREGEKVIEKLMTEEEAQNAYENDEFFVIRPALLIPYKSEHIPPYHIENMPLRKCTQAVYDTAHGSLISKEQIKELLKNAEVI